jgi:hypothetical protein
MRRPSAAALVAELMTERKGQPLRRGLNKRTERAAMPWTWPAPPRRCFTSRKNDPVGSAVVRGRMAVAPQDVTDPRGLSFGCRRRSRAFHQDFAPSAWSGGASTLELSPPDGTFQYREEACVGQPGFGFDQSGRSMCISTGRKRQTTPGPNGRPRSGRRHSSCPQVIIIITFIITITITIIISTIIIIIITPLLPRVSGPGSPPRAASWRLPHAARARPVPRHRRLLPLFIRSGAGKLWAAAGGGGRWASVRAQQREDGGRGGDSRGERR